MRMPSEARRHFVALCHQFDLTTSDAGSAISMLTAERPVTLRRGDHFSVNKSA
jgi:hypothetical protein